MSTTRFTKISADGKKLSLDALKWEAVFDNHTGLMWSVETLFADQERGFQLLEMYGVPRDRAKSVSNGITVLMTRIQREIDAAKAERDRYKAALETIKTHVCGERSPNWSDMYAVDGSRGYIADVVDNVIDTKRGVK